MGYPNRPKVPAIALDSVHDAVRYQRGVTEVRSPDQGVDLVGKWSNRHLDPVVVAVLIKCMYRFAGVTEGVMPIDHRGFPKQQNIV